MGGAHSRNKGANYERELVHRFRDAMPGADIKRGLQDRAGDEAADVECPVFWVEAKRGKQPNPRAALRQAKEACGDKIPLCVIRDDREPAFVVMDFEQFMGFVSEWWRLAETQPDCKDE